MAEEIDRWECTCCPTDPAPAGPSLSENSCGFPLNKQSSEFDDSIRGDIPDVAEKMRWLTQVRPIITSGFREERRLCDDSSANPGNWYRLDATLFDGVYFKWTHDPSGGGCALQYDQDFGAADYTADLEYRGAYSGTEVTAACENPPDNTLTTDDHRDLDSAEVLSTSLIINWTGTDIDGVLTTSS